MHQNDNSNWPQMDNNIASIVRGLFRTRNFIWDQDHQIVAEFALTWGQFDTLVSLRNAPPPHRLSPTELYDAVQVTSGGLTKILIGLEQKRLVTRVDNPDDGRSRLVEVTSAGCELVEDIINQLIKTNLNLLSKSLTKQEIDQLAQLLNKVLLGLEKTKCITS